MNHVRHQQKVIKKKEKAMLLVVDHYPLILAIQLVVYQMDLFNQKKNLQQFILI